MSEGVITYDPVIRGDSATLAIQFAQEDIFTGEVTLIDLSGAGIVISLTIDIPGGQPLQRDTASGLVLDPKLSIVTCEISPEQSTALPAGRLSGRYRITYPTGHTETALRIILPVEN